MKKARIVLINPWIYDFAAYDFWAKPMGLLYIAGVLREMGYEVKFIDCLDPHHPMMKGRPPSRRPDGRGKFHKEIIPRPYGLEGIPRRYSRYGISRDAFVWSIRDCERPDAILVTSMMTYWYRGVFEAIELCKEIFPGCPVILGGIYATLCPDHAESNSNADFVVKGDRIGRVVLKVQEVTGKRGDVPDFCDDLDIIPYPAFDLAQRGNYVVIISSRGCPYRCRYCASSRLFPGFIRRDPSKVADEIGYWVNRWGIRNIAFYDDALLSDPEGHLIPILQAVQKRAYKVSFYTPNGLLCRDLTERVALYLFRAGFKEPRLGLETVDSEMQKSTGGKVTNEDFENAVENLIRAGFTPGDIGVYLLAGLPGQRWQDVIKAIDFVLHTGARPYIAEYSPVPGTLLWEEAVRCSPFPLEKDPIYHNNSIMPCQWEGFSYQDLKEIKSYLNERIRERIKGPVSEGNRG